MKTVSIKIKVQIPPYLTESEVKDTINRALMDLSYDTKNLPLYQKMERVAEVHQTGEGYTRTNRLTFIFRGWELA